VFTPQLARVANLSQSMLRSPTRSIALGAEAWMTADSTG